MSAVECPGFDWDRWSDVVIAEQGCVHCGRRQREHQRHGYGTEADCLCGRNFAKVRGLREHLTKSRPSLD